MKKRIGALLLAIIALALCLPFFGGAAASIYYTAVNDILLSLRAETMPVVIDETLYVPFSVFNNNTLRIYYIDDKESHTFSLYNGKNDKITFDFNSGRCTDDNGIVYWYKAINRNSTVYVPVNFVCQFFGFSYSLITSDRYNPIVRVKDDAYSYSDSEFFKSAESLLKTRLEEYLVETGEIPPNSSTSPGPGGNPLKARVYMSVEVIGENTGYTLDLFDSYGYKAAFFLTAEEIEENSDIVRRIAGSGHTIGILCTQNFYEEYEAASAALFVVAKVKTLLISTSGGVDTAFEERVKEQGLLLWGYSFDARQVYSGSSIASAIGASSFRCDVRIGPDTGAPALSSALRFMMDNEYRVRVISETEERYVRYLG